MANLVFDFLHNYKTGERRESDPADAYQYDEGHVFEAVVPVAVTSCEIHYWARGFDEAEAYTPASITQNTDNSYTITGNIPNKFFETYGDLRVYIVVTDGDASITTYEGRIHICERSKPDDYVDDDPDNEATRVLVEAQEAAATATQKAADAATSAEQAAESARTLTLDTTLTQSGQAADAKAAGDEITSLKEDLTQSSDYLKRALYDISIDTKISTRWVQGYINSTGAIGTDPQSCVTDYIESNGYEYFLTVGDGYTTKVALYNSSKTFVELVSTLSSGNKSFRVAKGNFVKVQVTSSANLSPSSITDNIIEIDERTYTDKTLSKENVPADAKSTGDAVLALDNLLDSIKQNVFNSLSGTLSETAVFVPFAFKTFSGKKYKLKNTSTVGSMLAYTRTSPTGANVSTITKGLVAGNTAEYTASSDADYIVVYVNVQTTNGAFTIVQEDSVLNKIDVLSDRCDNIETDIASIESTFASEYDPKDHTFIVGQGYNSNTGVFSGTDATSVTFPEYIELPVTVQTTIKNNNDDRYIGGKLTVSRVFYYKADKSYISSEILLPLSTATIPALTKYVRFTYTILETTMTTELVDTFGATITNTVNDVQEYVLGSIAKNIPTVFHVGTSRTGANCFTTMKAVTEYIWNNSIFDAVVYVDKGTYDLETEFGSEWLESWVKPQSNPTASGLKVGNRTHYIFEHGAKILFNYSGENTDIATAFSPINIAGSCKFDNMQIEARNCRYCVHEDYYTTNTNYEPYQVEYNNCEMLYHEKTLEGGTNGEPIGAGCMPGSVSIINGGCFINEVNQADISYHNFSTSSFGSGTSMVVIKNAYMAHWCGFGSYGDSVVYGYVSGCRMKMEAQNRYVNNVIRQWGNTIESN